MYQTLIDLGTLRSAYALLNRRTSNLPFVAADEDTYIVALSALVETIVLSEQVIVPGVPHMSGEVVASLFGEAVIYRPIDNINYCQIEREAIEWAVRSVPAGDAIDAINVNLTRGSTNSSDCYRVEATFGFDRKNPGSALGMFGRYHDGLECRTDAPYGVDLQTDLMALLGARRDELEQIALNKFHNTSQHFVSSLPTFLYWFLVRSRCYDMIARLWDLPYLPHPLRARATLLSRTTDATSMSARNPYMEAINSVLNEGRMYIGNETGGVFAPFTYSPILPSVLARCEHKNEILPRTYDLRNSKGPTACRKQMAQYSAAMRAGDFKDAFKLSREISNLKNYLRADLGLPVTGDPISIGIYSASVPIPQRVRMRAQAMAVSQ